MPSEAVAEHVDLYWCMPSSEIWMLHQNGGRISDGDVCRIADRSTVVVGEGDGTGDGVVGTGDARIVVGLQTFPVL